MNQPVELGGWSGEGRLDLGRALLREDPRPMTAPELALATGKDKSNQKKLAESLVADGLLALGKPPGPTGRRGRPVTAAFVLADDQRPKLEAALAAHDEAGRLRPHQQLVFVEAGERVNDLFALLSKAEAMAKASWAGLCDGKRQELLIAFEGPDAVNASLDLVAALNAAELGATRASVAKIESISTLGMTIGRTLRGGAPGSPKSGE